MKNELTKKICFFLCLSLVITICMVPVGPCLEARASTAQLIEKTVEVIRYNDATDFSIGIKNANPKAKYTVSFANKSLAKLIGAGTNGENDNLEIYLTCGALADGKTKATVTETLNGKSHTVGKASVSIKKNSKFYSYDWIKQELKDWKAGVVNRL